MNSTTTYRCQYTFPEFPNTDNSIREEWPTYKTIKAFTPEECQRVIDTCKTFPVKDSTIQSDAGQVYTSTKRKGAIRWIHNVEETRWIFDKVGFLMSSLNMKNWHFNITGFDALQFTEYGPGDWFDWHRDMGAKDTMHRKLTASIALNDPGEYKGGGLQVYPGTPLSKSQGDMSVFSAFDFHRAVEVTEGRRYALVCWALGPVFA